jgi:hypothetical protein
MKQRLVDIALKEVGTLEAGGNNCGPRIREYQSASWLAAGPWPWCAAFCCWILRRWLRDTAVQEALGLSPAAVESWRCKDASAFGWEGWAKKHGLAVLPETAKAAPGDFVIFDFSHIGIVVAPRSGDYIETVEGNTNGRGDRDSESGDGVWRKRRHHSLVKCYLRMVALG